MSPRLARWYAEMAEAAKAATPQKPDPSRQLVLSDSAYRDEDTRYRDRAEQFGGVVFMGD